MPRAVLDSNVIVSAIIVPVGKPAQIILMAREGKFQCILSQEILGEVRRILKSKHIQKKYHPDPDESEDLIAVLTGISELIELKHIENVIENDPPDNLVLACAVEGGADYLVSGNLHFLNLGEYRRVKMISPAKFLELLASL
jgi:putative PIN family toxin of toxin-antitoxin system